VNLLINGFGKEEEIDTIKRLLIEDSKGTIKVEYSPADLIKKKEIMELIELTRSKLGTPDILINNAGMQFVSPIEKFPDDIWDKIIALNLTSAFYLIKETLPDMKKKKMGKNHKYFFSSWPGSLY